MKISNFKKGFTMIELLIVIAVLGILAVAVLSAINPIEQINRSRDTGSRSDAEQLLSAIDRFYASQGYYPWRPGPTGTTTDVQAWWQIAAPATWIEQGSAISVLGKLDGSVLGSSGELKQSFTSRITAPNYNFLYVKNEGDQGDSTYICFDGVSSSFQNEAKTRCAGTSGSIPGDLGVATVCDITVGSKTHQYLTCLP